MKHAVGDRPQITTDHLIAFSRKKRILLLSRVVRLPGMSRWTMSKGDIAGMLA